MLSNFKIKFEPIFLCANLCILFIVCFLGIITGLGKIMLPLELKSTLISSLFGLFGATIYCIRGFYVNYAIDKKFNSEWLPWFIFRPLVGLAIGLIYHIFLNGIILFLGAQINTQTPKWGFFAIAFYAGFKGHKALFVSEVKEKKG